MTYEMRSAKQLYKQKLRHHSRSVALSKFAELKGHDQSIDKLPSQTAHSIYLIMYKYLFCLLLVYQYMQTSKS